jgi:hypothetical protein
MTYRDEHWRMVGPFGRGVLLGGATLLLSGGVTLVGCGEEPAPPPPPPPPPVQTGPTWTIDELDMDERVEFPDRLQPQSESLAQAVADLATALISGDARLLRERLSPMDAPVLEALTGDGRWSRATSELQVVRVVRLDSTPEGAAVGIAVQRPDGARLMGWAAMETSDGDWRFRAMAIEPQEAPTATQLDDAELNPPQFDTAQRIEELIEQIEAGEDTGTGSDGGRNRGGGNLPRGFGPG